MKDLLEDAARRSVRYLEGVGERRVAPDDASVAALTRLRVPLPEGPQAAAQTLRELDELGSPATLGMNGGRFFGFVIGASLPISIASNWLTTAWDQNAALYASSPGVAAFESVALDWVLELLQLPATAGGAFVTGATMANFSALAAARHALLSREGWNVEADGLFGAPPITVVIGEEAHPTLLKSLGMLGLGRNRVVRVPVDGQGRIRADQLPTLRGPTILCTQAGNVNTGAFDPFEPLVSAAHAQSAWVHVDGAFGLWAAASPAHRGLVRGMAAADSWATDAHKWLNVPYDSGLAIVRDAHSLRAAMAISADYLPTESNFRNPSDYTPELSRRARGVDVWAALRTLGRSGVAELVQRCCAHARSFAEALAAEKDCRVLNDVVLNQMLVSFGDADRTRRVISALQQEGTLWAGPTVWQGQTAMRLSVSSWATSDEDVARSLAAIRRLSRS
ncbi:MAG TPA: pyridoxal-dependent decarboxylase [Devosia sp.]